MTDIKATILELLKSAESPNQMEASKDQERLCTSLLRHLDGMDQYDESPCKEKSPFIRTSMSEYNHKDVTITTKSVRTKLGNLPSSTIAQLAAVLSDFMRDRVDPMALLPQTQDAAANEEALHTTAITLTRLALLAAKIYAELISMPGGWGAGVVDVGTLSSMSALLRRWNVECCGNDTSKQQQTHRTDCDGSKRKSTTSDDNEDEQATKRSRGEVHFEDSDDEEDEPDYDDDSDDDFLDNTTNWGTLLSANDGKVMGSAVCASVAKVPFQKELRSWSEEAKEVLIECVVVSLMTTSALVSVGMRTQTQGKQARQGNAVVVALSKGLQACALISIDTRAEQNEEDDEVGDLSEKNQQTVVFILRGLLPILTMQAEVPNGMKGKEAAHDVAILTLEGLIESISKEDSSKNCAVVGALSDMKTPKPTKANKGDGATSETKPMSEIPSTGGKILLDSMTPRTGRKKKRVSFGTVRGKSVERLAAPALKDSNTPSRSHSRLSSGRSPRQSNDCPRPLLVSIMGLLQRLATFKGLDRANVRARIIEAVSRTVPHLPATERTCFLRFLIQLCHSKVAVHRLVGVELVGTVLSGTWFWEHHFGAKKALGSPTPHEQTPARNSILSPLVQTLDESMPIALLQTLNGRLSDKAPAVRARTGYTIAEMTRAMAGLESDNHEVTDPRIRFGLSMENVGTDFLMNLRKRAALDERATVRKASIVAIEEILLFASSDIECLDVSATDIQILTELCSNESVAARKAAASALTKLLQNQTGERNQVTVLLEQSWTSSVLPLVLDVEPSCVNSAIDWFCNVIVEPIIDGADETVMSFSSMTAWRILAHINEGSMKEGSAKAEFEALREAVRKATESYDEGGFVSFFNEVQNVATRSLGENGYGDDTDMFRSGVWCVLDALTDQTKDIGVFVKWIKRRTVGFEFLCDSWKSMLELYRSLDDSDSATAALQSSLRSCLRVMTETVPHVKSEDSQTVANDIKELLTSFLIGPEIIGAAVSALLALTRRSADTSNVVKECLLWINQLYSACEDEIAKFVASTDGENEQHLVRAIFLTGELVMIGFHSDEDTMSTKKTGSGSDPMAGVYEKPSQKLIGLGQAMLTKFLPRTGSSEDDVIPVPESARAHAFVTLGKLCLREESFAKKCLTLLVRELHQNLSESCSFVQSNALLVLGDLCVKYTNLADRYLPVMAACLQAGFTDSDTSFLVDKEDVEAALIRKHAVLMLSSLLLQDYIKWRGLLFHRFLVASSDSDESVAQLSEITLCGPLLTKYPKLFFNNFVESLFVLNKCTAHPIYLSAEASGDNGAGIAVGFEGINLDGPAGRVKRFHMYQLMLSKMSDEEKIGITARLAKDVLGAAVNTEGDLGRVCRKAPSPRSASKFEDKELDREESAYNVLSDAFAILTSPSLRVGKTSSNDEETIDDPNTLAKTDVVAAKGRLLSKISRKHLIEIVLPILSNLKSILQASCSPLLGELMRYMTEIFRAYKVEVREFLASDPTLLQELEYDARQFKKMQRQSGVATPSRSLTLLTSPTN